MLKPDATLSGTFAIGGDMVVHRLGFGAMRITGGGSGVWGPPEDLEEARRTLRRIPELGIDFIDTADSYGPFVSEELIAETLHPYGKVKVATKGGLVRSGPGPSGWGRVGNAQYLHQAAMLSLRHLKVERIDLWLYHRIDPKTPREESFEAIAAIRERGFIRHAGLSNVSVDDIKTAQKYFPVTTVQNQYSLFNDTSEDVLQYCEAEGIGFVPWGPLDVSKASNSVLDQLAAKYGATRNQLVLAWLLKRSPVMLPIPGTSKVAHLEENTAAASITLSDEDFTALSSLH
ncbi:MULTISPECIES: aldo/keto reductase [unclassified Mesorhizobium]|uniref:aldo/keto reductase n=1 Tax=unclassified Mesorhizobium TaxID=325217 RepID=UPI000FD8C00E|nr:MULTISPECIES: aldo/keto reductase [unclassified Mesorhizobium]TGR23002.1 aldo/keto reductase [Mesorhizobium sp. M8A.F.Ca.ET.197.01.1.1]TGR39087.1 aldo/keto reductase [bacterium M00.F.Ca.ET.199.01.1.1]TGR46681.1 aldo/keto reductase [Mesorhizobium sp. M8A.F.Ca.ET.198.01.1.1]TGV85245.1 aldo/keto reductase [Mesorhizobium sp. M00.F.Ca.ET.149.01.1.1]